MPVSATVGGAAGATRFIMVIQKIRQLRMQNTAIRFTMRSAARSFEASALQPDFRILWKVSIFQRIAYQESFSNASLRERTGRFVISFQSIFSRPRGFVRSRRKSRPKLSCTRCDKIVQAEAPSRPSERGLAGPGLLAHVLVSKYADHLPLYRQAEIYA